MNETDIKKASDFANQYGVKAVIYGGPGTGKTPIVSNLPNSLILMCEAGMLSMKKSNTPTYPAFTTDKISDFFTWWHGSAEAKKYTTLVIDSASQLAEIVLSDLLSGKSKGGNKVHGQAAYGDMANKVMEWMLKLYFQPQKNVLMIAKQQIIELNGVNYHRPYFPGQVLPIQVPHLVDLVIRLGTFNVPNGPPTPVKAFCCQEQYDTMARDRSGNLKAFEQPSMEAIVKKCLA